LALGEDEMIGHNELFIRNSTYRVVNERELSKRGWSKNRWLGEKKDKNYLFGAPTAPAACRRNRSGPKKPT